VRSGPPHSGCTARTAGSLGHFVGGVGIRLREGKGARFPGGAGL
jgi:hypothetical protein